MTVTTAVRPFKPGDRVHVDPQYPGAPRSVLGRTFVVKKVNPKNVSCESTDGGRGINYPKDSLVLGDAERGTGAPGSPVIGVPFVMPEFFGLGEIVTLKRPMPGTPADLPYVVIKDDGRDRVNVALVGNNDGRYVRAGRTGLVKRDREWLATRLLDLI